MANEPKKEWTIMFYFASDNPLAPIVVSQLKAITSAGFHQSVNVLCHFDPHTPGTDTHIFDVNNLNKLVQVKQLSDAVAEKEKNGEKVEELDVPNLHKFWGKNDPYVRNLVYDKLWNKDDKFSDESGIRQRIADVVKAKFKGLVYDPHDPKAVLAARHAKRSKDSTAEKRDGVDKQAESNDAVVLAANGDKAEPGPKKSLSDFLEFCAHTYPAEHYMLVVLGHGLVVGNDMFLFDESGTENSLTLRDLSEVLGRFKSWVGGKKLELIGFHSCSLSALEVAYEIRDTANYMLASQGPAFVGSWPYREILIRIFNDLIANNNLNKSTDEDETRTPRTPQSSIEKIFEYVLRYGYDFQLAGYSFDLCLCDLAEVDQLTKPLSALSQALTDSMEQTLVREAVLLAHWEAQSFWQESYTDIYDFCSCLKRRCERMAKLCPTAEAQLAAIAELCKLVIGVLENDIGRGGSAARTNGKKGPINRAAFLGPHYQYSHGLSIYFPWSEPTNLQFWTNEYPKYKFSVTGWDKFLQQYFTSTQRDPVMEELKKEHGAAAVPPQSEEEKILEEITCKVFNARGSLNTLAGPGKAGSGSALATGADENKGGPGGGLAKGGPGGGTGGDCDCPSFKNYPSFMHRRPGGKYDQDTEPKSASPEFFRYLLPGKKSS